MRKIVLSLCLGVALSLVAARPGSAQELGLGLSLLGDSGGTGFIVDYAKPFKDQGNGKTLSWVGDLSYHHKSFDEFFGDYSASQFLIGGGVRIGGMAGEKLSWHGQGLIQVDHASVSVDNAYCGFVDCDASDNSVVLNVGGALQYHFSDKGAARVQLDFPIGSDNSTTRFSLMYVLKMGN